MACNKAVLTVKLVMSDGSSKMGNELMLWIVGNPVRVNWKSSPVWESLAGACE